MLLGSNKYLPQTFHVMVIKNLKSDVQLFQTEMMHKVSLERKQPCSFYFYPIHQGTKKRVEKIQANGLQPRRRWFLGNHCEWSCFLPQSVAHLVPNGGVGCRFPMLPFYHLQNNPFHPSNLVFNLFIFSVSAYSTYLKIFVKKLKGTIGISFN